MIEAPPRMLGFIQDGLQRYLADIGSLGPDRGAGGKFLVLPPSLDGDVPASFYVVRSPTYSVTFAVRGFQVDRSTDAAVELMKQSRVYPLADAASPPEKEFLNGSGHDIDTLFPDDFGFFELLAMIVDEEPAKIFGPLERWLMQAIRLEKGTPFEPDPKAKGVLGDAARLGGAMARVNTYASSVPDVYFYPDRRWQGAPAGVSYTFLKDGVPQIDARNNLYYMAAGNSPAIQEKDVEQGSQYLWTYRDTNGGYLDGAKNYRLHVPPNIPIKNFWSVVVYDALSRSELQNGQPLPSVSQYSNPAVNNDGSVDIGFGPQQPTGSENWIAAEPTWGLPIASADTSPRCFVDNGLPNYACPPTSFTYFVNNLHYP